MTYSTSSRWDSEPIGTPSQVMDYARTQESARLDFLEEMVREMYQLGEKSDLNADLSVAHSAHECGNPSTGRAWQSPIWKSRGNPSGIGVTDSEDFGFGYETGKDAARAHMVRLYAYAHGRIPKGHILESFIPLGHRYELILSGPKAGKVGTIAQMTGGWWTDPKGHEKVARRAREMFPKGADMGDLQFGNVDHPPFEDRYIPDTQNGAWNDLGRRNPVGVCQHSMVGSLWGTDGWFRRGSASTGLTDYGIGGSTDGDYDGVIFRWNDPRGRRAGWANGSTDGLEGDGPLFVRTFGINPVNRDLVSIERSDGGNINTPMSPKQFLRICELTAYWFDQAEVPWDIYPLNPAFGVVTHLLHYEFATKQCAFPPVNDRIDEIQDRVRAIMKAAQTEGAEEPTVPPVNPPKPDHDRFPFAWTAKQLKARFGEVPYNEDGKEATRHFALTKEPAAGIVNAWVQRAEEEGRKRIIDLPRPQRWVVLTNESGQRTELFTFAHESGWVLIKPPGENATWQWAH